LANAICRFGFAHERYRIEDKIVDVLISAEALFLSSDTYTGEVKYRLSLRASLFLATDRDVRQAIFDRIKVAYDLRSSVVHGAAYNIKRLPKNKDGEKPTIEEFVWQIQEYLRIAILKTIQMADQADASGDLVDWDNLCLGGSQ